MLKLLAKLVENAALTAHVSMTQVRLTARGPIGILGVVLLALLLAVALSGSWKRSAKMGRVQSPPILEMDAESKLQKGLRYHSLGNPIWT
jgi:hypothetical protein